LRAYVAGRRALDRFGLSRRVHRLGAAVSVGSSTACRSDLDYSEDSNADTD